MVNSLRDAGKLVPMTLEQGMELFRPFLQRHGFPEDRIEALFNSVKYGPEPKNNIAKE